MMTKNQHSDKPLKIKYKALKELENGAPHKGVPSLFGVPKSTLSAWKKTKKNYSIHVIVALGLKE